MQTVILILTLINPDTRELSSRQQRMTANECVAEMHAARAGAARDGLIVFGGCIVE